MTDTATRNEDWLRTRSWDVFTSWHKLVETLPELQSVIGDSPEAAAHFLTLPAAESMPPALWRAANTVAQSVQASAWEDSQHPRDEHGKFITTDGGKAEPGTMHVSKSIASLSRQQLVERLRSGGYNGPVSYNKDKLAEILHQHEGSTPAAKAEGPKTEGVMHADKPIENLSRTQLVERLRSGGYNGPTSYNRDRLIEIARAHENAEPPKPRDVTARSEFPGEVKTSIGPVKLQEQVSHAVNSDLNAQYGQAGGLKATVASKLTDQLIGEHRDELITLGRGNLENFTHDDVYAQVYGGAYRHYGKGDEALKTAQDYVNKAGSGSVARGDEDRVSRRYAEAGTSDLIRLWSTTSNDEHPKALALQDAAAEEFGFRDHHPWNTEGKTTQYGGGKMALDEAVAQETAKNGELYKDFVRAQYDETQKFMKDRGIEYVQVHRGFRSSPGWARAENPAYSGNPTVGGFRPKLPAGSRVEDIPLRPMSSFSSAKSVANLSYFGKFGTVVSTVVPRERILSTPATGFGSHKEKEVVVLAGPGSYRIEH